jgi:hypothetical protein
VLETLSAHPLLRRIGLHAIPPGGDKMVIVANGNATRIATSASDFAAVKDRKIYGPKVEDGQYYNMKNADVRCKASPNQTSCDGDRMHRRRQ